MMVTERTRLALAARRAKQPEQVKREFRINHIILHRMSNEQLEAVVRAVRSVQASRLEAPRVS